MTQTRKEALIELRDKVRAGRWNCDFPARGAIGLGSAKRVHNAIKAYHGSLDAAKALRIALGLPVPPKMHSDARLELLGILDEQIAKEPDT
jgi:hypothetical protein